MNHHLLYKLKLESGTIWQRGLETKLNKEHWKALSKLLEEAANEVETLNSKIELLTKQLEKQTELLHDLNVVLKTAMHNGHHDLIQRVSDVCKGDE